MDKISIDDFFSQYIDRDICFNHPDLFRAIPYYIPKGDGGVRQCHFLEAPLRILYYALGFYFLELTSEIRKQLSTINKNSSIFTYYGAKICLKNPQKSQIHYQEDYQEFNRNIRRTVRRQIHGHKVAVLHIDIQDFFHSIAHSSLIRILDTQIMPESRLRLRYDESTKLTIRDILFLVMQSHKGLPLSKQNIVSNLLSHLFLCPIDNFMRRIQIETLPSLTFHRYVDDMFLTVQFPLTEDNESIGTKMLELLTKISAFLSSDLDLRLNPLKTRLNIVATDDEVDKLIEDSRLVSFYQSLSEDGKEHPKDTLNRAIKVLKSIKIRFQERGFVEKIATNDDLALKECFQKIVTSYIQSSQARTQLETVFLKWNPVLMPKSMNVLIFLISHAPNALEVLFDYVQENLNNLPSLNILYLAERLMLLEQYDNQFNEEIAQLSATSSNSYIGLINRLITPLNPTNDFYIQIKDECLKKHHSIMRQVRCAVIAEKLSLYGLAYNHLLNVLQEWCYCNQNSDVNHSKYNRHSVVQWLTPIADNNELAFVMTLFDRRNRNTISHPGNENTEVSSVTQTEYENHLETLNQYLSNFQVRLSRQNSV